MFAKWLWIIWAMDRIRRNIRRHQVTYIVYMHAYFIWSSLSDIYSWFYLFSQIQHHVRRSWRHHKGPCYAPNQFSKVQCKQAHKHNNPLTSHVTDQTYSNSNSPITISGQRRGFHGGHQNRFQCRANINSVAIRFKQTWFDFEYSQTLWRARLSISWVGLAVGGPNRIQIIAFAVHSNHYHQIASGYGNDKWE